MWLGGQAQTSLVCSPQGFLCTHSILRDKFCVQSAFEVIKKGLNPRSKVLPLEQRDLAEEANLEALVQFIAILDIVLGVRI